MAAKKSGPKKASKGKNGCLKNNGKLKKGFKWAKGRKGYCQPVAAKKAAKKGGKKGGAKKSPAKKRMTRGQRRAAELGIKTYADAMNYLDVGGKVTKEYEAAKAAKSAGMYSGGAGI